MKKRSIISAFFFILFSFAVVLAQQTVITGQLLGSDGKPMAKANVHLGRNNAKTQVSVDTAKDGSYQISTNETGLIMLQFTGVSHQRKYIPLFIETNQANNSIKLNVKLSANEYKSELGELRLIQDFDNPDIDTSKVFQKQADGTYVVEFETSKDRVEYEIFGLEKSDRIINGTQSDDYVYDGDGDYRSIVLPKNGKVKIVVDPGKLVRSNAKSEIVFDEKNAKLAAFAEIYNGIQERELALSSKVEAAVKAGKNPQEALANYSEADKAAIVKNKISQEKDPFIKQALILDYFTYFEKEKDNSLAVLAINEIPASSPLWSIEPFLISGILNLCKEKPKADSYFDKFLAENKDNKLKTDALLNILFEARASGDDERLKKYFDILQKDYPDSGAARLAKARFSLNSNVKIGATVPEFSVISLEDSKKTYSPEALKGKYYLIDFWATWCGPCVGEMGNLHKAYEKFKSKNFEILSLSFDNEPEDVAAFRQGKWKMPWLHTFVLEGFRSELAKRFEVVGIPKPILVDPNGKIIATEEKLRGEALDKTLSEVLNK